MLIVEELFLLMTRSDGKPERGGAFFEYPLNAAVMTDLILAGHLALGEDRKAKVTVQAGGEVGDVFLTECLESFGKAEGRPATWALSRISHSARKSVAERLATQGVVEVEDSRWFGLVEAKYPTVKERPERQVRTRLAGVLVGAQPPTVADATLLVILQRTGILRSVLEEETATLDRKELKSLVESMEPMVPVAQPFADLISEAQIFGGA